MDNMPHAGIDARLRPSDILPMLRRGWVLIVLCTTISLIVAGVGVMVAKREYQATALLQIVPQTSQEVQGKQVMDIKSAGFQETERFYRTQMALFQSRKLSEKVIVQYNQRGYDDITLEDQGADLLRAMIEAYPQERSQLVQVSVTHHDPNNAAILANLVAKTFVTENIAVRQNAASDAKVWLEKNIVKVEQRHRSAVTSLLQFKSDNNLVDVDQNTTAMSSKMSALDHSFGSVTTERVLLESRISGHKALLKSGDYATLASMMDVPVLITLTRLYSEARSEHAAIAARYGAKHPEYSRSKARVAGIEHELTLETKLAVAAEVAQKKLLLQQEKRLTDERGNTKGDLLERQRLEASYMELKRAVLQAEATHRSLLKRSDELDLSSRTQLNNAHLIDEAIAPRGFVRPRITLTLLAGLAVGLIGGILLAFARALLDETILSPFDIESYIRLPLLGVVPHMEREGLEVPELFTHIEPRSSAAEAMRGVRTMVEMGAGGAPRRRLLVTSSVASEGKTNTSINLGIAFAQLGRDVVVVEADHRRARLHKVFRLGNERGIADVLSGEISLDKAIFKTEVPGLYVVPLGTRNLASIELLASERMDAILSELDRKFAHVIIDTTPSAALSEGVILSRI
ncbi:MAG: succinoglycan biosynthesis transport protein ExoP, partial [Kiritimatiellia bacterium]